MGTEQNAGWGKSPASKKWHYFPENDSFSLCRKIGFFFGKRDASKNEHPDNCAECKKKLTVLLKKAESK